MTIRGHAYGEMLTAARKAAGLTQIEVSKRIGVAQSTYSKWEAGESDLQGMHLRPLAKVLGLPLEDVVPASTIDHEFEDPSERIGLKLIREVASAIEDGRLGSRQARILLDLLVELAPEPPASGPRGNQG
jgi:transcriptional regulator with XRE-family HTH domain